MASKEAEDYTNELCTKCPDEMYCHKKCQEYLYSCEVFDAGISSVPNNIELVDEFQALREELKLLKEKSEWHNLEENPNVLPVHDNYVLVKYTSKTIEYISLSYYDKYNNEWSQPLGLYTDRDGHYYDYKVLSWKEIE